MSLYDDVILPSDFTLGQASTNSNTAQNVTKKSTEKEIASWNTNSLKLLQNQVEAARKRQQTLSTTASIKRDLKASNVSPVINLNDKRRPQIQPNKEIENIPKQTPVNGNELRFNLITGKVEKVESLINSTMDEEYDPMRPNDYEKVVKELKMNKRKSSSRDSRNRRSRRSRSSTSRSRSRSRRRRSRSRSSSRSRSRSRDRKRRSRKSSSSEDDKRKADNKKVDDQQKRNNMFAPPSSLIEADAKPLLDNQEDTKSVNMTPKLNTGLFKAEKMMAKMGYKEGEGLGRNNQGMSMALQVEKTGRRSGRIIHEKDVPEPPSPIPIPTVNSPVIMKTAVIQKEPTVSAQVGIPPEVMKNMSKVVLLRNMVAPGEVDSDLEAETKEECQKYGEVNSCVIYVMSNKSEEEAVRIFVEFKTLPSAIKALTDLNGRFFGGRKVKATFYNLDKLKRNELSDDF
ncbi:unnamed protein product [Brachionus calyciflorus]|uniref:Splicing factor 45 n=1 Tax=Brachionus calyciflorus TaxID=104777 RepID=A0A813RPV9_9BILA|nr:unnamed protein product [Brachionus calyciflorus]